MLFIRVCTIKNVSESINSTKRPTSTIVRNNTYVNKEKEET